MMRILITGATGFVGRRLARSLALHNDVLVLARKPSTGTHSIQMDLSLGVDVSALPDRVDAVVHLAQSEHYRNFPDRADDIYAVNVESTFRLLEYARTAGADRFILASSGGIYGYSHEALPESAAPHPPDFYLSSKHLAEVLLFAYERFYRVIAVRPFFIYGAGQRQTMFVPRLVRNVLLRNPITLSSPDGLRVNPIHISDAVDAFARTVTVDYSGPINIGGPDVLTLGEIARIIGSQLGRTPIVQELPDAPGNIIADITLMSRILGLPQTPFSEGVGEVCREAMAQVAIEGH